MLYQSAKKYRSRDFDGKIKSDRKTQFLVHLFLPEIEVGWSWHCCANLHVTDKWPCVRCDCDAVVTKCKSLTTLFHWKSLNESWTSQICAALGAGTWVLMIRENSKIPYKTSFYLLNRKFSARCARSMLYQSAKKYRPRDFDGKIKSGRKTHLHVHLFCPYWSWKVDTASTMEKQSFWPFWRY